MTEVIRTRSWVPNLIRVQRSGFDLENADRQSKGKAMNAIRVEECLASRK